MYKLVVKLKAIKYKEDSFYYLFFYIIYQVKLSSCMLLDHIIRSSFLNIVILFFMPLSFSKSST